MCICTQGINIGHITGASYKLVLQSPQKLIPTTMLVSYTLIGVSVSEDLWELWSSSAAVCERREIVECLNACNGKYIEIDQ